MSGGKIKSKIQYAENSSFFTFYLKKVGVRRQPNNPFKLRRVPHAANHDRNQLPLVGPSHVVSI